MASAVGTENPRLDLAVVQQRLFAEPWSFGFFQAVRLLGLMQSSRAQVGYATHPSVEGIRFGSHATLSFPASEIHTLTQRPDGSAQMEINFLGLIGPLGVLPKYITELAAQRLRVGDTTLQAFFNLFDHRLTSFFYRAWEKHHFTVGYERDRSDPVTGFLLATIGLGSPLLQKRQVVEDHLLLFYAGLFGLGSKPAVALEAAIGDYFGVQVEVEPFIGTWRKLEEPDQCFLDQSTESDMLGFGAVIGDEVWDQQSRVRLRIGPLSASRYFDFLPSGSAWTALQAIAQSFCGNDLEFEVQLLLDKTAVPACELGDPSEGGPALGWTSWIKSQPVFQQEAIVTLAGEYGGSQNGY